MILCRRAPFTTKFTPMSLFRAPALLHACTFVLLALSSLFLNGPPAGAQSFETAAKAAILIDVQSGATLFAKNADERLPPASMSKLMTGLMVFERLKNGSLKLDDELPVSEKAWRTGGSKMFVKVGDRVTIDDLLQGIIVQSGNDACVVVAEGLAGSEEAFARQMSERAQELGLTNSHFANSSGLDDPEHYMSARDLAIVGRIIINEYPEYYHYYSQEEFEYAGIKQGNRNPLLQAGVPGIDGMKTGHTSVAGYGLVATAQRDGRRLLLVMAGLGSERQRRQEGERLMEYGFRDFEQYALYAAGATIAKPAVWMGDKADVALVAEREVAATMTREARKSLKVTLKYDEPIEAPVAKGQELGTMVLEADGMPTRTVPLVAADDVGRAGMFGRLVGAVGYLVWGGS
jgi:serine-type D-Ala-D-Ala carboxypeptidase (penicillin-binding protein 5/6)